MARSGSTWTTFLEALEKAAGPVKKPSSAPSPWWEEPLYEDVKAALVAKEFVTRGRGSQRQRGPGRRRPVWVQQGPPPAKGHPQGQPPGNGKRHTLARCQLLAYGRTSLRNNIDRGRIQARGARPDGLLKYTQDKHSKEHRVKGCSPALATRRAPTRKDPDEYKARKRVSGCPAEAR